MVGEGYRRHPTVRDPVLGAFSRNKRPICALLKNDSQNHFYLRFFAQLEPRYSRLRIRPLSLLNRKKVSVK